ncbi:DegT/DnrJ/EryC1/StrS family aminotransferase [Embleya sp. NPDC055664]|uniref:DegT/DnrJ/EryC1/StrS family aminotransferase n=1 Tax=Embleya sp. NPDC059237 TaxID=3346784 RepID=UPI00367881CE
MPGPGYASFGDEERRNIAEVLDAWQNTVGVHSQPVAQDSQCRRLEREAASRLASPHCLTVNSGTSALLTAFAALGIGPGDEVIVPGYMYVACLSAVAYSGATPVLAEIDESLTLDPADVLARITPRTRAIMPVHMLGASCDMDALTRIAREHDLLLIEDAAQACGGTYRGRPLGGIGEAGAFSLNVFKVVTGGDGGLLLTRDAATFQRAYSFHHHGWFPYARETGPGDVLLGLNLRMGEFGAAVARAQLARLDDVLARTRALKRDLTDAIGTRDGVAERVLHDAAGDCATVAVYVFDDREAADEVASGLGSKTLLHSPKHHYGGLPELRALADPDHPSCPFRPVEPPARGHTYRPGALPRTDDVLSRSVALTVGLTDTYLGADFGVDVFSRPHDVAAAAEKFRATRDAVLG